jgi:hypothetical protein
MATAKKSGAVVRKKMNHGQRRMKKKTRTLGKH